MKVQKILGFLFLLLLGQITFAESCNRSKPDEPNYIESYDFCASDFAGFKHPKFEQFPVKTSDGVTIPLPESFKNLPKEDAEEWRAAILSTYADKQSFFAGHYLLVQRGCGAGCRLILVVDLYDGTVYRPREISQVIATINELPEATLRGLDVKDDVITFYNSSNLLALVGSLGEVNSDKRGIYYFLWQKNSIKLVKKIERIKAP